MFWKEHETNIYCDFKPLLYCSILLLKNSLSAIGTYIKLFINCVDGRFLEWSTLPRLMIPCFDIPKKGCSVLNANNSVFRCQTQAKGFCMTRQGKIRKGYPTNAMNGVKYFLLQMKHCIMETHCWPTSIGNPTIAIGWEWGYNTKTIASATMDSNDKWCAWPPDTLLLPI